MRRLDVKGRVESVETPEVIRRRRVELGLSQAELADAAGLDKRQIGRYEGGTSQPSLPAASKLAAALGITIDELAGGPPTFAGRWWSCWSGLDETGVRSGPVDLVHRGHRVEMSTDPDGPDAGLRWRAESRLTSDVDLLGWYTVDELDLTSRGTILLEFKAGTLGGDWLRVSFSQGLGTGSVALARTLDDAHARLAAVVKAKQDTQR